MNVGSRWRIALLGLTLFGAGCAQKPVNSTGPQMCKFNIIDMGVETPTPAFITESTTAAPPDLSPLASLMDQRLRASSEQLHGPPVMLAMSGGSQHGAFGAGVLSGWGGTGQLPAFDTVTGVSTGAILASFAFVNRSDLAREGYAIDSESQLLKLFGEPTGADAEEGKLGSGSELTLLRKGAFADLAPLAGELDRQLTDDIMRQIADRHTAGATLLVGAVDVDSGNGVAFDMGEMAVRHRDNTDGRAPLWKACYIQAIVASSSAPFAAKPVFIDNRMYIDGGVRFGIFANSMLEVARLRQTNDNAGTPPVIYALINGTLEPKPPKCPKQDSASCTAEHPMGQPGQPHRDWDIVELLLRTEDILVNQVYRFSAAAVKHDACDQPGCFNFLKIDRKTKDGLTGLEDFRLALPPPLNAGHGEALTCPEWGKVDIREDNPIQFQKRYMRCLIAYGEYRAGTDGWGMGR